MKENGSSTHWPILFFFLMGIIYTSDAPFLCFPLLILWYILCGCDMFACFLFFGVTSVLIEPPIVLLPNPMPASTIAIGLSNTWFGTKTVLWTYLNKTWKDRLFNFVVFVGDSNEDCGWCWVWFYVVMLAYGMVSDLAVSFFSKNVSFANNLTATKIQ